MGEKGLSKIFVKSFSWWKKEAKTTTRWKTVTVVLWGTLIGVYILWQLLPLIFQYGLSIIRESTK
jgi:hypothetical protein